MKNVMIGLSGGVDSAVSAFLLKKAGYNVAGATFILNEDFTDNSDAKKVANYLEIPYFEFDFRDIFQQYVIDNFIEEYKLGHTPNPCIQCNKFIKFPAFLEKAKENGFDYIATGHYARTDGKNIYKSKNWKKDQSYMLYNLDEDIISRILFPIEDLTKDEVRSIAEEAGIPVAHKTDSQDICFIPDGKTQDFILSKIGTMPDGNFVDGNGTILGKHKGIYNYTIGQHKGLGLSTKEPLYVKKIIPETNEVELSSNDELYTNKLIAKDFHWIHNIPDSPINVQCKIRYAQEPAPAIVGTFIRDDMALITFEQPQRAVTPGQSAVIYDGDMLLGGGIIK